VNEEMKRRLAERTSRTKVENAAKRTLEFAFAEANLAHLGPEQRAAFARQVADALLAEMKTGDEARPKPPDDWAECIWCDGLGYVRPTCCECDVDLTPENRSKEDEDTCKTCFGRTP